MSTSPPLQVLCSIIDRSVLGPYCMLQIYCSTAALLVYWARHSEHITPFLRDLHWLRMPERTQFCLCVLMYRSLSGMTPSYLTECICWTTDLEGHSCRHSLETSTITVTHIQYCMLGATHSLSPLVMRGIFRHVWNSLPSATRVSTSLITFHHQFKTVLYQLSFLEHWHVLSDYVKCPCSFFEILSYRKITLHRDICSNSTHLCTRSLADYF